MGDLERLLDAFDEHRSQYACASFRYAVMRNAETPRILRGAIRFRNEKREPDRTRDYGRISLGESIVDPESGVDIMRSLLSGGTAKGFDFHYPGKYELQLNEVHRKGLPVQSFDRFVGNDWPSVVALVYSGTYHVPDPKGPVVSVDHPLYTDANRAVQDWLGWSSLGNSVGVVLPDFRARIDRTTLSEKGATMALKVVDDLQSRLVMKVGLGYGNDYVTPPVLTDAEGFSIEFPRGIPSSFHVFVLDKQTGKVLDWQEFYTSWSELPKNVEFSVPEQQLTHLIDMGESDTVEFKGTIDDGSEFAETLVAFANSRDGVVFVGVDDHAAIVGIASPDKEKERIQNFAESYCEPTPPVDVQRATLQGKEVLVVRVRKGSDPPYVHRFRGVVYVRRGGTDRPAKRGDLDALYRRG